MRFDWSARAFLLLALLVALGSLGCGRERADAPSDGLAEHFANNAADEGSAPSRTRMASSVAPGTVVPANMPAPDTESLSRQLVRRARMDMVVRDVTETVKRVKELADSSGGYVANLETGGSTRAASAALVLRVPADRLEPIMSDLRGLAVQVRHESSSLEDVTAQAVDLDARLRALRATETELLGVLGDVRRRGGKAEDVMAVYREMTGIRMQIEQLQGQRNELAKQVALSFLSLNLISEHADEPLPTATWHVTDTFRSSTRSLVGLLRGLTDLVIYLVIAVAPIALIIGAPVVWVVKQRRRRIALRKDVVADSGA